MNDEQQLWRDVQRFMNQFPGFVAVAKKIGEIGDLAAWQAAEQRKLETVTQEVEKQRAVIATERAAADKEAARKLQELEASIQARDSQIQGLEAAARANFESVTASAQKEADRMVGEAKAAAKKLTDVIEPRKAALEAEIASLIDKITMAKAYHADVSGALAKAKDDHASFLKKLLGTAEA